MEQQVDMDRIVAMHENGYSHKPLVRVDITDEEVLDTLEGWGVFDFALDDRESVTADKYACWMTDAEDIERDSPFEPGTSCVIVNPVMGGYGVQYHSHDGKWEPMFGMLAFPTLEAACEKAEWKAQWESGNRKALEEYRKQAA